MNEEIVRWAVVKRGDVEYCYHAENDAKERAKRNGGTVVKLTGEMPRKPIKYSVELWGDEWKKGSDTIFGTLFGGNSVSIHGKSKDCPIKYRVTIEELPDEV